MLFPHLFLTGLDTFTDIEADTETTTILSPVKKKVVLLCRTLQGQTTQEKQRGGEVKRTDRAQMEAMDTQGYRGLDMKR